jgi:hypothetical protein
MAKDTEAPKERVDIVHKSRTDDRDEGAEPQPGDLATAADQDPADAEEKKTDKMKVGISMSFGINTTDTEPEDDEVSINPEK